MIMRRNPEPVKTRSERTPFCSMVCFKLFLAVFTMVVGVVLALCINLFDSRKLHSQHPKKTTSNANGETRITTTTTTEPPIKWNEENVYAFVLQDNRTKYHTRDYLCLENNHSLTIGQRLVVAFCNFDAKLHYVHFRNFSLKAKYTGAGVGKDDLCIDILRVDGEKKSEIVLEDCYSPSLQELNFTITSSKSSLIHETTTNLCISGRSDPGQVYAVPCENTEYMFWDRIPISNLTDSLTTVMPKTPT